MKIDKSKLIDFSKIKCKTDPEFEKAILYTMIKVEIAKSLINYRKKNNLTQKELAEKINVNQSMIAKLEHGNYNPSIKFLFDLSVKLDGNYDFFLEVISKIKELVIKENNANFQYEDQYETRELKVSEEKEEYKTEKPKKQPRIKWF